MGDKLLYASTEIRTIEQAFGMNIGMGCTEIGLWTEYNYRVKADDIAVLNTNSESLPKKIAGITGYDSGLPENDGLVIFKENWETGNLPTVHEILKRTIQ
jgi:hypothetical protein